MAPRVGDAAAGSGDVAAGQDERAEGGEDEPVDQHQQGPLPPVEQDEVGPRPRVRLAAALAAPVGTHFEAPWTRLTRMPSRMMNQPRHHDDGGHLVGQHRPDPDAEDGEEGEDQDNPGATAGIWWTMSLNDPPRAARVRPPPIMVATSMTTARTAPRMAGGEQLAGHELGRGAG